LSGRPKMNRMKGFIMDFNEASENLKILKRIFNLTDKNCLNCDGRIPFWMSKNHCPFYGCIQEQWISECEESYAIAL